MGAMGQGESTCTAPHHEVAAKLDAVALLLARPVGVRGRTPGSGAREKTRQPRNLLSTGTASATRSSSAAAGTLGVAVQVRM